MDHFPLFELPPELRDMIYGFVGVHMVTFNLLLDPPKDTGGFQTSWLSRRPRTSCHEVRVYDAPYVPLLRVSRRFAQEYKDVLGQPGLLQLFHLEADHFWDSPLPTRGVSDLRHMLRSISRLEISVSGVDYWGIVRSGYPAAAETTVERLEQYMPSLRDVRYDYHSSFLEEIQLHTGPDGRPLFGSSVSFVFGPSGNIKPYTIKNRLFYHTKLYSLSTDNHQLDFPRWADLASNLTRDLTCNCYSYGLGVSAQRLIRKLGDKDHNEVVYRLRPATGPHSFHGLDLEAVQATQWAYDQIVDEINAECQGYCRFQGNSTTYPPSCDMDFFFYEAPDYPIV